jgi:hypothetical protein
LLSPVSIRTQKVIIVHPLVLHRRGGVRPIRQDLVLSAEKLRLARKTVRRGFHRIGLVGPQFKTSVSWFFPAKIATCK